MTTGTGSGADVSEIPEIDIESPNPPTTAQVARYISRFLREHEKSAKARGFQGRIMYDVGYLDTEESIDAVDGPPIEEDHHLRPSSWERGTEILADDETKVWTVQNNLLLELWKHGLYVNIVTFIQPIEDTAQMLPVDPNAGFPCSPIDLQELSVNPTCHLSPSEQDVAEYLVGICADWGDWSPIPRSEFVDGVESEDLSDADRGLIELEARGCVRCEARPDGQDRIHIHPDFVDLFDREESKINCPGTFFA